MKKQHIALCTVLLASSMGFTACNDDDPDTDITLITTGTTEPNDLDRWLTANYNEPYNIDFKYRYEDNESDRDYYMTPCTYEDAVIMAHLVKYTCVDLYSEVAGTDFTCRYFPKMFTLYGEWKYESNNAFVLGTAEGGRKVILTGLNYLQEHMADIEELNHYYLKTIHHEFTHILNQTYAIPTAFRAISEGDYVGDACFDEPYKSTHLDRGFISDYAQTNFMEDFAEMMSLYITWDKARWDNFVAGASPEARALINQKRECVIDYMLTTYGIDIDELRESLIRRQDDIMAGKVDLTDLTVK